MQPREEIAYLGPNASYTHQAAISAFGSEQHTLLPQTTIEDVFSSVQSGRATYGVVPFENSTNGSVVFTLDLFADQHSKHPDIVVCGERYVEVHHCLLGHPAVTTTSNSNGNIDDDESSHANNNVDKVIRDHDTTRHRSPSSSGHATPIPSDPNPRTSRSSPLTSLSHIKKLYSHPQAWGQCKTFLSCHLKGVERQDVSSTSRAAELVAADETGTTAAISSSIAAEMHRVHFLARDIEDERNNCTRFLILRKLRRDESASSSSSSSATTFAASSYPLPILLSSNPAEATKEKTFKSLLSFTVHHSDNPGALADALAVFKSHGLNLTSINPRPSGEAPWHYIFFVEFQGRRGMKEVDDALVELGGVVGSWRWLGSWENALVVTAAAAAKGGEKDGDGE